MALQNLLNTGSVNGLVPVQCQAITWQSADLSSIRPSGISTTNYN